jgi:hypothetical protein
MRWRTKPGSAESTPLSAAKSSAAKAAITPASSSLFPARLPPSRLRRDQPDLEYDAAGNLKPKQKYLSPPGRSNMLYLVPGTDERLLQDPTLPVLITEGERDPFGKPRARAPEKIPGYSLSSVSPPSLECLCRNSDGATCLDIGLRPGEMEAFKP